MYPSAQERLNNSLYAAIGSGMHDRVRSALAAGADANADNGRALILCADGLNYPLAKLLVLEGDADIEIPLMHLQKMLASIPHDTMSYGHKVYYKDANKVATLKKQIGELSSYKTALIESSLPLHINKQLRNIAQKQDKLAADIESLRAALKEATEPKVIPKDHPGSLRKNAP